MTTQNPNPDDEFAYPADTLGMEAEEMRRLGHKVVDLVVDRLIDLLDNVDRFQQTRIVLRNKT